MIHYPLLSNIQMSRLIVLSTLHSPHIKCQSDDKTCGQCQMTGLSPVLLWFVLFIIGEWTDACVESPNRWSQSAGVGQGREGTDKHSTVKVMSGHVSRGEQRKVEGRAEKRR